jgi:hypothetical protein
MRREEPGIRAWKKLGEAELGLAVGGLPPVTLIGPRKTPTWIYMEHTPDWAIANAQAVGFVPGKLD